MSINTHSMRRIPQTRIGACASAVAVGLLVTGCSTPGRTPTDTGSMATPQPMAPGILSTTGTGTGPQQRDTGNMAYPSPLPQGNLDTTRVR